MSLSCLCLVLLFGLGLGFGLPARCGGVGDWMCDMITFIPFDFFFSFSPQVFSVSILVIIHTPKAKS